MNEKKKKIIISTCLILVLILAVVGISYAAFQFVGQGQQVNQITTGTISMNYEEGTNVIRLNNALPTTDTTGKVRLVDGEYFDFSVTTNITGDALINWEIAAEDFDGNTFDGSNVKFYLTKIVDGNEVEVSSSLPAVYSEKTSENKKTGRPANMMSLLTGSTSTQGEEITNYRLRLYVDEAYNPQGDGGGLIFKTRINVYGKVSTEEQLPIMRSYVGNYNNTDYHLTNYKDKITSIVTKDNTTIPDTAIEVTNGKGNYWDVSAAGDDSVVAYIENKGTEQNLYGATIEAYKLTIGGNGGVSANPDSSDLFHGFTYLSDIDLTYLDTSKVVNMSCMFYECISLKNLDLRSFDTSNVTDMHEMFYMFTSREMNMLESVNLSNFDTSKVENMSDMFYGTHIETLDLSSFDTSKVTDISGMFNQCLGLSSLDLSNFDTSNVTNMSYMFASCFSLIDLKISSFDTSSVVFMSGMFFNCVKLKNLHLNYFDTSNVSDMSYMFTSCSSLTSLDLINFDTSNVTNMNNMFKYCSNLTNITVSNLWVIGETTAITNMFENCGTDHVTVTS